MDDFKAKIDQDPDYIHIKRFDYSMKKLLERYPEGVPEKIICQALQMTNEEVQSLFDSILVKLRRNME